MVEVEAAVRFLRSEGILGSFSYGIILGTGLGPLADIVTDSVQIPFERIPGYPRSSVSGHDGKLIAGTIQGTGVIVLAGRSHFYETGDPAAMKFPIQLLAALGVENLLLTNSVGSVNREIGVGQLCIVKDHINLTGINPLVGEASDNRFVSLESAYSPKLRRRLKNAATEASLRPAEGVLMWFPGPSFETAAEIRVARAMGADLVTMSVVPEVILARFFGMDVAAVSIVTNFRAGLDHERHTHDDTKAVANEKTLPLRRLVSHFFKDLLIS